MQLKFQSDYSEIQNLREKLYPLFEEVFGIEVDTFKDFYSRGFWDPTYTPFTYFNGDQAVANVSFFEMPIIINGEKHAAAGIQSVMTHPDYRGKGLMKSLLQRALDHIDSKYKMTFLMTTNPELYIKYGFKVVKQHYFVKKMEHNQPSSNKLVQLNAFKSSDLEIIQRCFRQNIPSSKWFYPLAYEPSFYLNMYNPVLKKLVHYSPDLDVILIYSVFQNVLELFDIVGPTMPSISEISSVIPEDFKEIHLHFCPDLLLEADKSIEDDGDYLMVRGDINLDNLLFKFPMTAAF